MSFDIVSEAFERVAKEKAKYKTTTVEKLIELEYDLGTLLAIDTNEIDSKALRSNKRDEYLLNLARDNTQLLLNRLWELPFEKVEEAIVVKLPKQTNIALPREKPMPKQRSLSKWEAFAKEKGLQKKKKAKVTWDDILKKWVPVHGYRRATAEKERDWLLEVPQNSDPYEDQFEKKADKRKNKVAKNEYQRLRNIASSHNIKVPFMGLPPTEKLSSDQLGLAEGLAKVSTASLGKFQPKLPKEKTAHKENTLPGTKKRKLPPVPASQEKDFSLGIIDKILNKKPKLDISKAVNKLIHEEESQRAEEKNTSGGKGKKLGRSKKSKSSGGGAKKKGFGAPSNRKKPTGASRGKFPSKKGNGRKRR